MKTHHNTEPRVQRLVMSHIRKRIWGRKVQLMRGLVYPNISRKTHTRMSDLFLVFLLLSIVCLIAGIIKPTWFNKVFKGGATRKKTSLTFGICIVLFFILFGVTAPKSGTVKEQSNTNTPTQTATNNPTNTNNTSEQPTTPQTDEQKIANAAQSALKNTPVAGSGIQYKDVQIAKDDSDRPAGSKLVTVSYNVNNFLDKNSLLLQTGELSSNTFQSVFPENDSNYDVIVWYYGDTTDTYGNKKSDVILSYGMDRNTNSKINWSGFDKTNLCNWLNQQAKANNNLDTSCNVLANIK